MKTFATVNCCFPNCKERTRFTYDRRTDYYDDLKSRNNWTCTRHTNPEELLTVTNTEINVDLVCVEREGYKYWKITDQNCIRSGFTSGICYKAFAEDFSVGTILNIHTTIQLPESLNK